MIKENSQKESGYIDKEGIIALIIIGLVCFAIYWVYIFPIVRGPAADVEVNAIVQPNGELSEYKISLQFADDQSYSQFLSSLNSQKMLSIDDYEFRTFSSSQKFALTNDSGSKLVTIEARESFDPNNVTKNIRIKKNSDNWEFEDKSIVNSSHLPENYINKLTYTLTIPSKLIYANTLDNSSIWFSEGKKLTWTIDRNKNPLNPHGENIGSPLIYAKFEVPKQNEIPVIPVLIGLGILVILVYVIVVRR